jgi:hypothetical protein
MNRQSGIERIKTILATESMELTERVSEVKRFIPTQCPL